MLCKDKGGSGGITNDNGQMVGGAGAGANALDLLSNESAKTGGVQQCLSRIHEEESV